MKKAPFVLFLLFSLFLLTPLVSAAEGPLVTCNGPDCKLDDLKNIPGVIVDFLKNNIAIPASILFLTIGGLLILISGADPQLYNLGKKVLIVTIIGMILVFAAQAIVKEITSAL